MTLSRQLSLLSIVLLSVTATAADYDVPRTQWGLPDLQGVWNFSSNVPMQRPEEFGEQEFLTPEQAESRLRYFELGAGAGVAPPGSGIEAYYNDINVNNMDVDGKIRTSLIVYPDNGRLPPTREDITYQPGGTGRSQGDRPVRFVVGGIGRDGPEDRGLSERCLVGFNSGPPFTPSLYNNNVQIIQNRDHVVIMTEMIHDARIVKLGEVGPLDDSVGLWSGDSRGHWEGDTLVVTTRNFNGRTQSFDGYGASHEKVLTERFTRTGPDAMRYEFSIADPGTFTDQLRAIIPMTRVPEQLYEYACHEGNYGMVNMLRAARRSEAEQRQDSTADLSRRR